MASIQQPTLIVFGGLPGTGKTTISRALSVRLAAAYLRIDAIEQAIRAAGIAAVGPAGYLVANALAEANLALGLSVVADCVKPVRESRLGWREAAVRASARLIEIQLICSDADEHRRRVERRIADIPGHLLPTWAAVVEHRFEPWHDDHLVLDTAALSPTELVNRCQTYVLGHAAVGGWDTSG